jgi:hypothetical protein
MTFEDLSQWDLDLIKSVGVAMFATTSRVDRFEILTESTLRCIQAKGFDILPKVKDLTKEISQAIPPKQSYGSATYNPTATEIIAEVFNYLRICKFEIIKDVSREPTWSSPKASWYANIETPKKSWQF